MTTGICKIGEHRAGLGVMDFSFLGGSMGSVVGEKLTRLIETNIGKDLQYIRFNGMIIGGLAGLVLYAAERLFLLN